MRAFSFALVLVALIEVKVLNGPNPKLFEGRTITLVCVKSTINQTSTVSYKNDEVIKNARTRNLTLTLKYSLYTGLYKCGINETNSTKSLNVIVKGVDLGLF